MPESLKALLTRSGFALNPTVVMAVFLIAVIMMMVLPAPAWLLDLGLTVAFASSIMIFMVTLFSERPLDFSSFPTVLLGSLMLRLSLNISSTKLIIANGHTGTDAAGDVIEAFANFIVGGNLLLGTVVFTVIMIVNFIVITKGAGRMAEVGARFALDAMPGKQLAIDADVASGAITHEEATKRRKIEQEETTFFGSLDGASKFVKGDAIAGLMITALNFFVGIAVGTITHEMPVSEALETYSLLTIGDGLVTQIPAVITSVASALLLSKGGAHGAADKAVFIQFTNYPQALYTVSGLMGVFALIPGIPFMPFMIGAVLIGLAGKFAAEEIKKKTAQTASDTKTVAEKKAEPTLGDTLEIDEIKLEFSKLLIPVISDKQDGVAVRINALRKAIASDLGYVLPEIRLTDNPRLTDGKYVIRIQGVPVAEAEAFPGHYLVIKQDGVKPAFPVEETTEPVYGAPAWKVKDIHRNAAIALGLPTAGVNDVIATHLTETIKSNMRELVSRSSVQKIIDTFLNVSSPEKAAQNRKLIEEFIPESVTKELLHKIIRMLLEERVSVRNLPLILEGISEAKNFTADPEAICERVRRKLALQIATSASEEDGTVPIVQIGATWEKIFKDYEIRDERGEVADVALPPAEIANFALALNEKLQEAGRQGRYAAVAAPGERRRLIRAIMDAKNMRNPVIAYEELHPRLKPALLGVV